MAYLRLQIEFFLAVKSFPSKLEQLFQNNLISYLCLVHRYLSNKLGDHCLIQNADTKLTRQASKSSKFAVCN